MDRRGALERERDDCFAVLLVVWYLNKKREKGCKMNYDELHTSFVILIFQQKKENSQSYQTASDRAEKKTNQWCSGGVDIDKVLDPFPKAPRKLFKP